MGKGRFYVSITDAVKHILIYRTADCVYMITVLIYILRTVEVQKYSIITLNSMMLVLFSKWGHLLIIRTHLRTTMCSDLFFI